MLFAVQTLGKCVFATFFPRIVKNESEKDRLPTFGFSKRLKKFKLNIRKTKIKCKILTYLTNQTLYF